MKRRIWTARARFTRAPSRERSTASAPCSIGRERSEDAFAHRTGSLADAVYDRSRADIVLAVATSALQRAAQSLQAVANMQV